MAEEIRYEYPNLSVDANYTVVFEVPAIETDQIVSINNIPFATVQGTSREPTRYLIDLQGIDNLSKLRLTAQPTTTDVGALAAISQVWVVESQSKPHRNKDVPLILPDVLDDVLQS